MLFMVGLLFMVVVYMIVGLMLALFDVVMFVFVLIICGF